MNTPHDRSRKTPELLGSNPQPIDPCFPICIEAGIYSQTVS